jgi:hypothetical protein
MKLKHRKNMYSNSTGTCTYDPITHEGHSYSHWKVCAVFDDIPVFNIYSYSVTTSRHQRDIYSLFAKNFPDTAIIKVKCPHGIKSSKDTVDCLVKESESLIEEISKGRNGSRIQSARIRRMEEIHHAIKRLSEPRNEQLTDYHSLDISHLSL